MTNVRSMFRLPSGVAATPSKAPEVVPDSDEPVIELLPMRRRHLKAVVAIEQRIFPSPWSIGLYLSELAQPATRAYYVARVGPDVVGYAGMMMVVGEGHVTTIGVAPEWQRRGIGRRLLLQLAREARRRSAQHLTLEVRVSNVGAQALYHEFGFVPAGIRKNYYAEVNEDALVMWAHDIDTDQYGRRLDAIEARLLRGRLGHGRSAPGGGPREDGPDRRAARPGHARPVNGRVACSASRPPATRRPRPSSTTGRTSSRRSSRARSTCTPATAASCPSSPAGPTSSSPCRS